MWVCVLINLNITIHDATTTPSIDHLIDLGRKGECNCGKFCTGTWASYGNSSDKETMTADRVKGETFLKAPTVAMRPSSQPRQRGTAMVDDDCRGQGEAASQPLKTTSTETYIYGHRVLLTAKHRNAPWSRREWLSSSVERLWTLLLVLCDKFFTCTFR